MVRKQPDHQQRLALRRAPCVRPVGVLSGHPADLHPKPLDDARGRVARRRSATGTSPSRPPVDTSTATAPTSGHRSPTAPPARSAATRPGSATAATTAPSAASSSPTAWSSPSTTTCCRCSGWPPTTPAAGPRTTGPKSGSRRRSSATATRFRERRHPAGPRGQRSVSACARGVRRPRLRHDRGPPPPRPRPAVRLILAQDRDGCERTVGLRRTQYLRSATTARWSLGTTPSTGSRPSTRQRVTWPAPPALGQPTRT